jgi:hypothetical protein
MTEQKILIKHSIEDIFKCQENNCVMIRELSKYCDHNLKTPRTILMELVKSMDDITKSHNSGINPNDIAMKSMIRDSLNKIVNNNYNVILEYLKSLNYTSENHFALLANEIILKCMGDVMASKGIDSSRPDQRTPSEIYIDIANEFSAYMIEIDGNQIKFRNILAKECQQYFSNFMNKNEHMDHNNMSRISNFKGFMNMIGLLYAIGLFPIHIIEKCFERIIDLVLDASISQEECDNFYCGYERLMNRLLFHFEKDPNTADKNLAKEFGEVKSFIKKNNDAILKVCPDEKNNNVKQLRKFTGMQHHQNILRFNALCEKYKLSCN